MIINQPKQALHTPMRQWKHMYLLVPYKQSGSQHNLFHFYHDECQNLDVSNDYQDIDWANHQWNMEEFCKPHNQDIPEKK